MPPRFVSGLCRIELSKISASKDTVNNIYVISLPDEKHVEEAGTGNSNLSTTTIHCDLVVAPHGEKMHKSIILVVNWRFLAAVFDQWVTKALWLPTKMIYLCNFLSRVSRIVKKKGDA